MTNITRATGASSNVFIGFIIDCTIFYGIEVALIARRSIKVATDIRGWSSWRV